MPRSENQSGTSQLLAPAAFVASLVLSALLMAIAIGSQSHAWLGWLSLLPLMLAIRYLSPLRAMACGSVWGGSLCVFAIFVIPTNVPATIGSFALLSTVPAIYALLGAALTRSRVGFSPLLLGMAWIGVEYALTPLSLRFGLLAGAFAKAGYAHVVAGLLGYGFVAFVVMFANGLLLSLLIEARVRIPGPLYVQVASDPEAWILSIVLLPCSLSGRETAQPRAPPSW